MRSIAIVLGPLVLALAAGCASTRPAEPKTPEPIAYNRADFNPPSEVDLSFAPQGVEQGPAIKRSAPGETSYQPRLVSREHD